MGKVRSVEYDGGIKTKYIQESDGKLTICLLYTSDAADE